MNQIMPNSDHAKVAYEAFESRRLQAVERIDNVREKVGRGVERAKGKLESVGVKSPVLFKRGVGGGGGGESNANANGRGRARNENYNKTPTRSSSRAKTRSTSKKRS